MTTSVVRQFLQLLVCPVLGIFDSVSCEKRCTKCLLSAIDRRFLKDSIALKDNGVYANECDPRELDADIRNPGRPEDSRRLTLADKKMMLTKALEIDPGVEVSWRGIQNLLILLTVAFCLSLYVSP